MKSVVMGIVGPVLDRGAGPSRWEHWRPSVSVCQQEDLLVSRFELLYQESFAKTAKQVRQDIQSVSPETEVRITPISFKDPWDFQDVYASLHDFCKSYPFNEEEEEYLVHITTGTHVAQICLFLLAETRHLPAKLLQTSPPRRKHTANVIGNYQIIDLDLSRYDRIASRFQRELREDLSFLKSGIETKSPLFNAIIERIEKVAIHSDAPILLEGPTGAGKSHLARRIYELKSARREVEGPFVEVNCATLRGDAAMSTLFGHKKGAFTGAQRDRAGLLNSADKGILFLDEIGELGLDEQAMLLRAIEEKKFLPVGSDQEEESNFQLIAGTNRNLKSWVAKGEFRDDLLARINLWTFCLPGLKDRKEDIAPNLDYELDQFETTAGIHARFNKEARSLFLDFARSTDGLWKANFRDLNAAVTRMATLAPGARINVETVKEETDRLKESWQVEAAEEADSNLIRTLGRKRALTLDRFDQVQLEEVIRVCHESRSLSDAGRTLFSVSREKKKKSNDADRLRKYLAKFDLDWARITG